LYVHMYILQLSLKYLTKDSLLYMYLHRIISMMLLRMLIIRAMFH
jgi:hypothetical protein